MKYYYRELPENYKEVKVIDAKKKSTAILFNVVTVLLMLVIMLIIFLLKKFDFTDSKFYGIFIFFGCYLLYVVLHELTHGLFYKIFTHEKLKFGLTLSVAYCGVPNLYIKKIPMLITCLAPFVIYSVIALPFIIILPANALCFYISLGFAFHFGGCCGDLYGSFLILKYPKELLVNDTGAKQTFYLPEKKD